MPAEGPNAWEAQWPWSSHLKGSRASWPVPEGPHTDPGDQSGDVGQRWPRYRDGGSLLVSCHDHTGGRDSNTQSLETRGGVTLHHWHRRCGNLPSGVGKRPVWTTPGCSRAGRRPARRLGEAQVSLRRPWCRQSASAPERCGELEGHGGVTETGAARMRPA